MEEQLLHSQSAPGPPYNPVFQQSLPNSNTILVLGILSIVFCWWHLISFAGIVLGIVTIILSKKEISLFNANPNQFTISSLNNVKTGRICAIIGLIISIIVFLLVSLFLIGFLATLPFWGMLR